MERKDFHYKTVVDIELTGMDLAQLIQCSRLHYDGLCKSLSQPGNGGLFYGWAIGLLFRSDKSLWDVENLAAEVAALPNLTIEETVTWQDLDIICKVLEMESAVWDVLQYKDKPLSGAFNDVLRDLRAKHEEVNAGYYERLKQERARE